MIRRTRERQNDRRYQAHAFLPQCASNVASARRRTRTGLGCIAMSPRSCSRMDAYSMPWSKAQQLSALAAGSLGWQCLRQ